MNRYKILFKKLKNKKEACFIPFLVLGDPFIKLSYKIISTVIQSGADAIELGFPFSDPMADGIIIQKANKRAIKSNINYLDCFLLLKKIRKKFPLIPIGLLIYVNLIINIGKKKFYKICKKLKIDSILIVDVPVEESVSFLYLSKKYKISQIYICPPNAKKKLIKKIALFSKGYIYLLSRNGVTGIKNNSNFSSKKIIKKFKKLTKIPLLQGFGIHNKKQIKKIISKGIKGVICGSIIIKLIEKNIHDPKLMLYKLKSLIKSFKNSTKF